MVEPTGPEAAETVTEHKSDWSLEYGGGKWHWFCQREGCRWSGTGLFSEGAANREATRHQGEFHPEAAS